MLPYKDYSGMQLPGVFLGKKSEKTFQYDDSLPPLPVPPLEHSLYRYLDSVRPFVSEEEFKKTEALAKQFAAGIGKDLHEKLLEKAKHSKNWLEEWWEKYAYLSTRTPHAPYMTMAGPGSYNLDIWQAKEGTQIERISLLTWLGAVYWNILRREQLAIDRGSKTIVWSMNQYQRMFNSCKIPQPNIDALKLYFKTEAQGPCPSHVIVLVNGHIYMLDTLDANNQPYTPPMLEQAFTQIKQAAYSSSAGPGLGSLTAMAREPWFKLREHLIELHPDNGKLLELLQSAVYCISLDERSPATLDEAVRWATMDDCTDRWFDKSYALIVYRNGFISSACDHTGYEAMPMQMFAYWGANAMALNDYRWMGSSDASKVPAFRELKFVVDNKIQAGIREAKAVFQQNGAKIDVLYHEFKEYGKEWLRKFKLHPDTFMQMALQLTYYRLHGRGAPTYETAVTRQFYHGRTETLRVCTSESMSMCRAMQDSWASAKVKKEKLMFAMDKHLRLMQEAMNNRGCDRHLMGLQLIAMEEGLPRPALFSDPSWVKSGGDGNFILSTSFLGFLPATGLVPAMCDNGYGFFYSIIDSQMQFFCTSYIDGKDKKCRQFVDTMCQSLRDLRQVLEEAAVPSKL